MKLIKEFDRPVGEDRSIFLLSSNINIRTLYDSGAQISTWHSTVNNLKLYFPYAQKTVYKAYISGFGGSGKTPAEIWIIPKFNIDDGIRKIEVNNLHIAVPQLEYTKLIESKHVTKEYNFYLLLSASLFNKHDVTIHNTGGIKCIYIEGQSVINCNPKIEKGIILKDNRTIEPIQQEDYKYTCLERKQQNNRYTYIIQDNQTGAIKEFIREQVYSELSQGTEVENLTLTSNGRILFKKEHTDNGNS